MRVLLITPTSCYQIGHYLAAARHMAVDLHLACDQPPVLAGPAHGRPLQIDFADLDGAVKTLTEHTAQAAFDALLGVDELTCGIAARAAKASGIAHNPPGAVTTAHNKYLFRQHLRDGGHRCPGFELIAPADNLNSLAARRTYPCVLKPLQLSASRGVLRADTAGDFLAAAHRINTLLRNTPGQPREFLVEDYIPGSEFALEGLLENGRLRMLALFDKPDPLHGPVFEESIYVTPSRLPRVRQQQLFETTARVCASLGLHNGPVHAELRLNCAGAWIIELATRCIGGRCSSAVSFGNGVLLEELILRNALGEQTGHLPLEPGASGVMMIPIPAAGRLHSVTGLDRARRIPGITAIRIDIARGALLVPLPEGDRYLGFIFARGPHPAQVIRCLKQAHALLRINVEAEYRE